MLEAAKVAEALGMDPAHVWDGSDFDVAMRFAATNALVALRNSEPADG